MATSLTRVLFVDAGSTALTEDGSLEGPYRTIQAAIGAVPVPATNDASASAQDWTILVAPGDYDEPLAITGPVRLAILGIGGFRLGRYTTAGGSQANIVPDDNATPRNIEWTYNATQRVTNGAAPQLVIGTIGALDTFRRGKASSNLISGSVKVSGAGWTQANAPQGGTAFLQIANTQIDAGTSVTRLTPTLPALDASGFSGTLVDRHYFARFRGAVIGALSFAATPPAYVWANSFMSAYEGLVTVSRYYSIEHAGIEQGMTVAQVPQLDALKSIVPPGIVDSTVAGTFTGPAGSLLLDSVTNDWFIRNGGTLAGGATKRILGATPVGYVHGDATLKPRSATVLVTQHATVTLPSVGPAEDDIAITIKVAFGTPVPQPAVTVVPATGQKIDGKTTLGLKPLAAVTLLARDGGWWIVSAA